MGSSLNEGPIWSLFFYKSAVLYLGTQKGALV